MNLNSFSHLKASLADLVKAIPSIRVRYSYDSEFKNHIVEIKPVKVYRDDTTFARYESALCLDFSEKFPYESIIFISEYDTVKIVNPNLVLEGLSFKTLHNHLEP